MVDYTRWVRVPKGPDETAEIARVDALAENLRGRLARDAAEISALNLVGTQSKAIQEVVGRLLVDELGFHTEVVLAADSGFITRARADFFYPLGPASGVVVEVERGGAITNNHDLKDLWKAHLATNANHLFLVVPRQMPLKSGGSRTAFTTVSRRMGAFFQDPQRYVDVLSVHVFGY